MTTTLERPTIEKLQALLVEHDGGALKTGSHKATSREFCAMEFIAKVAGEPWTDAPQCVHPALAEYCRTLNDGKWPSDAARTETMLPLLAEVFGSRDLPISVSNIAVATVREILPPMLRAVAAMPKMPAEHAKALTEHAGKCSEATAANAADAANAAADAADAANAAAAYAAARYAAYAAQYAADARYAAHAANAAAARYAARYAAYAADAYADAATLEPYKVSIALVIREIQRARAAS